MSEPVADAEWQSTACILCECNCGIEVQLGGAEERHLVRVRGDKSHPISKGYLCEKALRLDHYQNGPDRITSPLRRRPDGSFEEIDWDTAIREVAAGFSKVRDEYGGEKILYYGGGGQGNHLPGAFSTATLHGMGSRYRSNALAQEKTGEMFVQGRMMGAGTRGDFTHCDVALFIGKNPWFSHGIPHARVTLKKIARDPARKMIVIDPRRTETAELADIHLAVKPARDAWLMAALVASIVQDGHVASDWVAEHTVGIEDVLPHFEKLPVGDYCDIAGVPEAQVREAARLIGEAKSVATAEDLGVEQNRNSTLVSYLHKLVWALTGNFGKEGAQYVPSSFASIVNPEGGAGKGSGKTRRSPVTGSRIIGGLLPCNVVPDEILTDHPDRFRAMLIEATNPVHSIADSKRMREAVRALDFCVVIDCLPLA